MLPGVLGAGVYQINILVGVRLATELPEGSVSFLYFADRVSQLPLGVVGAAIGVALLPLLTRQLKSGDDKGACVSQNRAIEYSLLLTLPAMAALMVLPTPIITVLFQRGEFGIDATDATAAALCAFSLGMPAYVLIKALAPGFFAREDTSTPVNASGLAVLLYRRGMLIPDKRLCSRAVGACFASTGMALVLWKVAGWLVFWLSSGSYQGIIALAFLVIVGIFVYVVLLRIVGVIRWNEMCFLLSRK
jgi:putative peptidoglycan lipid II flippase